MHSEYHHQGREVRREVDLSVWGMVAEGLCFVHPVVGELLLIGNLLVFPGIQFC
jgi:hypothetical protein